LGRLGTEDVNPEMEAEIEGFDRPALAVRIL